MGDVHVIPTGPEWVVQVGDDLRGAFRSRREALTRAGELAAQERGELVLHGWSKIGRATSPRPVERAP
jgi:hypothetical protein